MQFQTQTLLVLIVSSRSNIWSLNKICHKLSIHTTNICLLISYRVEKVICTINSNWWGFSKIDSFLWRFIFLFFFTIKSVRSIQRLAQNTGLFQAAGQSRQILLKRPTLRNILQSSDNMQSTNLNDYIIKHHNAHHTIYQRLVPVPAAFFLFSIKLNAANNKITFNLFIICLKHL